MRRTKIVATIGPVSKNESVLQDLLQYADLVRINFSHADHHPQAAEMIRKIAKSLNRTIGLIADLQGPKIRVSRFKNGKVFLKDGADFILDAAHPADEGNENIVGIDYKELPKDVSPNDVLLLSDGRIVFIVTKVEGTKIYCKVESGGELSNNKGINRKGGGLSAPALTDKDREDLKIAVSMNVDYIAISFPRCADDIEEAKDLIAAAGGNAGVIAKIERIEAVEPKTLDEIIDISDGIMVARGDLAVEIGNAEVPAAQKYMINRARDLNKPVITATEMMESMITSVVPTRAEVSDVANAVLDGTDAVMLSAETATGEHPVLVVTTMDKICLAAEKHPTTKTSGYRVESFFGKVDEAISMATMYSANHLNIKAIISLTESGSTPLWMSRIRSGIPIFGLSRHLNTLGKMALYSDVYPINFDVTKYNLAEVKRAAISELKKEGYVSRGDLVIITCGDHVGMHGGTNSMTILQVE